MVTKKDDDPIIKPGINDPLVNRDEHRDNLLDRTEPLPREPLILDPYKREPITDTEPIIGSRDPADRPILDVDTRESLDDKLSVDPTIETNEPSISKPYTEPSAPIRGRFIFDTERQELIRNEHVPDTTIVEPISQPTVGSVDLTEQQGAQLDVTTYSPIQTGRSRARSSGELRYGVISDVHKNPMIAHAAVQVLVNHYDVDVLLGNGDLADSGRNLEESQKMLEMTLEAFGKSGKESIIQPGSHETVHAYESVVSMMKGRFGNIIDALEMPRREALDHHLVFIPGSDLLSGGEFRLAKDDKPTGKYLRNYDELCEFTDWEHAEALQRKGVSAPLYIENLADIPGKVTDPEKTIVVCHIPPKFDLENTVDAADYAHYWELRKYSRDLDTWTDISYEAMSILPVAEIPAEALRNKFGEGIFGIEDSDEKIADSINKHFENAMGTQVTVAVERKGSRGNEDLAAIYQELGITKGISGHFHASGHNAHTTDGSHVSQGAYTNDLWWNSGHLENGYCGVLTVKDGKVSYQNVDLRNYLTQDGKVTAKPKTETHASGTILNASGQPMGESASPLIISPYDK